MFSFVDIRLALLLSAAVLLARGQGEDDSKYHFQTLIWVVLGLWHPQDVESPQGCWAVCWNWSSSAGYLTPVGRDGERCYTVRSLDGPPPLSFLISGWICFVVCCSHRPADTRSVRVLLVQLHSLWCALGLKGVNVEQKHWEFFLKMWSDEMLRSLCLIRRQKWWNV